jgi:hypothetical protein
LPFKSKYKPDELSELIHKIHENIIILNPYEFKTVSQNKKYKFYCRIHHYEFESVLQSILKGHGCKKCGDEKGHEKLKSSIEKIKKKLLKMNIEFMDEKYINSREYYHTFKCMKDGHIWKTTVNNVLRSRHLCSVCSNKKRRTTEEIQDILNERYDNKIIIESPYKNMKTKSEFRCMACNHVWETTPYPLLNTLKGCPICNCSIGEQLIKRILDEFKIPFEYQKVFLINSRKIIVDFFIPSINCIIEFNGEQHYKPVRFNGIDISEAEKNLEKQKLRDKTLKRYCKDTGIKLLILKYTEKNYETIKTKLNESLNSR